MFDDCGLINADNSVAFTQAAETLALECDTASPTLGQHFRRHVEPALRQFVFEPSQKHSWFNHRWTNDAAESINHLLKMSEWHPRCLPQMVDRLYKVTSILMTDLRRSLYSHGNYVLCQSVHQISEFHTTIVPNPTCHLLCRLLSNGPASMVPLPSDKFNRCPVRPGVKCRSADVDTGRMRTSVRIKIRILPVGPKFFATTYF